MPHLAIVFVRIVEAVNYRVGRMAMYLLFLLAGVLMWVPMPTIPSCAAAA